MIRLLTSYIAGALEPNRRVFETLGRTGAVQVSVLVPEEIHLDPVYVPGGKVVVNSEETHSDYRVIPVPLKDPVHYSLGFRQDSLRQIIRREKPDLIHVIDEPTSPFVFQAVWLSRLVAPRSRVLFYAWENQPHRLPARAQIKWRATWLMTAGGVGANSESLMNLSAAGFPKSLPLERVFWGIPTEIFRPLDGATLKRTLGLPNGQLVGFVGRRVPEKGIAVLLKALRHLPSDVHCLMVGSGPGKEELLNEYSFEDLRRRTHVVDTATPERLAEYFNCMDVLAVPSLTTARWKEQYGRVIPESMGCGIPVVASSSGAIPEVVGDAGILVNENDPESLSSAISSILFDSRKQAEMSERGLKRAHEVMSIQAMVNQLIAVYERTVGR